MKEIKAYVHQSRIGDVIAALKSSPTWGGLMGDRRHNLTAYIVKGSLLPIDDTERHFSMELGEEVVNEYKVELLCDDAEVDALVDVLVDAGRTGQAVAGWITVTEVSRAVPIH